ncbi:MAG: hypothetical protein SVC26_08465 [Pseudomonadota bacterium]|nr:hypothetical protein [Pseudomonadota bacterium]
MKDKKPHGNTGNKHACKPDHEKTTTAKVYLEVSRSTKARWVHYAQKVKSRTLKNFLSQAVEEKIERDYKE